MPLAPPQLPRELSRAMLPPPPPLAPLPPAAPPLAPCRGEPCPHSGSPESSRVSLLVALMPAHDASWRSERRDSERRDDASPLQQLLLLFLWLWRRQPCPSLRAGEGGPP